MVSPRSFLRWAAQRSGLGQSPRARRVAGASGSPSSSTIDNPEVPTPTVPAETPNVESREDDPSQEPASPAPSSVTKSSTSLFASVTGSNEGLSTGLTTPDGDGVLSKALGEQEASQPAPLLSECPEKKDEGKQKEGSIKALDEADGGAQGAKVRVSLDSDWSGEPSAHGVACEGAVGPQKTEEGTATVDLKLPLDAKVCGLYFQQGGEAGPKCELIYCDS